MPDITAVLVAGYPGHRRGAGRLRGTDRARQASGRWRSRARSWSRMPTMAAWRVRQTGDNLGRKGMGWGGGVGLAVGLFAPPLLASVAVGAVAGGVIGKFVDHRVENEIHDKIGENLPPGSAGIIAVFDDEQRLGVEQALARRAAPVGRPERQEGRRRAEGVARRGDGEVQPGPDGAADPGPELRRHDRAHARRVGPGLDDQHDAEAARGRAERAARPDRRRRLRQPVDVRRAGVDAGDDARRRAGSHATTASTSRRCARRRAPRC